MHKYYDRYYIMLHYFGLYAVHVVLLWPIHCLISQCSVLSNKAY